MNMTVDEMREELRKHCDEINYNCKVCKLNSNCDESIYWEDETDENIKSMYEILKGENNMKNKNYMEQIAKMLGVEIGEEFKVYRGNSIVDRYKFTQNGLIYADTAKSNEIILEDILTGQCYIKKQWKPKEDDIYYVPSPGEPALCKKFTWKDDEIDNHCYENNIICKTEEEAIILTEKMLKIAGE